MRTVSDRDVTLIEKTLREAQYKRMKLSAIKPAPYNPRKDLQPEDSAYQKIRNSINDHGFIQPIIYNKKTGHAVGGNQRLKILINGGVKEAVCAVIDVPLAQEKRINIALNNIGNMYDQPKLRSLMLQLRDAGYDLRKTAFDDDEIARITQDWDAQIGTFFLDDDEDGGMQHQVRTYKCPYCGEVFEK